MSLDPSIAAKIIDHNSFSGKFNLDDDEMINCMELSREEVLEGMGTQDFPHGLMAMAMCLYLKYSRSKQ